MTDNGDSGVHPDKQSVATQHDAMTYAAWWYSELRPLAATPTLPQVCVRLKRKKNGPRRSREESPERQDVVSTHDANDFTPDRLGAVRRMSRTDLDSAPEEGLAYEDGEESSDSDTISSDTHPHPDAVIERLDTTPTPSATTTESGDPETATVGAEVAPVDAPATRTAAPPPAVDDSIQTPALPEGATETPLHEAGDDKAALRPQERRGRYGGNHPAVGLVCSTNLSLELDAFVIRRLQLRTEELRDRHRYVQLVERIVQNVLGRRATVTVHGSLATGLALQSSDIDVLVSHYEPTQPLVAIEKVSNALLHLDSYEIPDLSMLVGHSPAEAKPAEAFPADPVPSADLARPVDVSPAVTPSTTPTTTGNGPYPNRPAALFDQSSSIVRQGQLLAVQTIVATRVPVVKVSEKLTGLRCDVSFGGGEHFPSMWLTAKLLADFRSARPLLLFMKHCVKRMQIGESEPGGITSFPLYLLAMHFFQHGLAAVAKLREISFTLPLPTAASQQAVPGLVPPEPEADDGTQQHVEEALKQAFPPTESSSRSSGVASTISSFLFPTASAPPLQTFLPSQADGRAGNATPPLASPEPCATLPTPQEMEQSMSFGQVVLEFCIYYSYLFDYENTGIHFQADGTSRVVEKPATCRYRGQHLHLSSPFDERYDVTARMAHTREFQMMCHGLANIVSYGTLQHLLEWVSPDTVAEDLTDVLHYLHLHAPPGTYYTSMHHHYGNRNYAMRGHGGMVQVHVGRGGRHVPQYASVASHSDGVTHVATEVNRSPRLPYASAGTTAYSNPFPRSGTPTAVPPQYSAVISELVDVGHHPPVASTGTMTVMPQAPPLVPPPITVGAFLGAAPAAHRPAAYAQHVPPYASAPRADYAAMPYQTGGTSYVAAATSSGGIQGGNTAFGGSLPSQQRRASAVVHSPPVSSVGTSDASQQSQRSAVPPSSAAQAPQQAPQSPLTACFPPTNAAQHREGGKKKSGKASTPAASSSTQGAAPALAPLAKPTGKKANRGHKTSDASLAPGTGSQETVAPTASNEGTKGAKQKPTPALTSTPSSTAAHHDPEVAPKAAVEGTPTTAPKYIPPFKKRQAELQQQALAPST